MKITKKHIKELEKQYIGKRIVFDDDENMVATIDGVSSYGQLIVHYDNGSVRYIEPDDEFHEVCNWEM